MAQGLAGSREGGLSDTDLSAHVGRGYDRSVKGAAAGTVFALVTNGRESLGDDVALLAPGRPDMSYARLEDHVDRVAASVRALGVGAADRVALVARNGPEAASAFLGISAAAVCAPLNPSYARAEHDFYLADLDARALVIEDALDTPARDAALELGIAVVDLRVEHAAAAGTFTLGGALDPGEDDTRDPDAAALVLHTSGTTSRPKIVPLTGRQLAASASNVAAVLGLQPADRCLNVMPLFHIHGIVAALLASLRSGGSIVCSPGFHQLRFFEWLRELRPTWTTAVPTMHQAVLERARRDPALVAGHSLRFVRSSSAALPVPVLEGLEETLGVPVVEAYGMTEAAHQMASNPLPPNARKSGSVGPAAGPEIAILDSDGRLLPAGEPGEVAIRGENVFAGYESNPEANAAGFTDGWFRTGDQGRMDEDGYLFLVGRLKEIINRGGEKVSPLEVDEALLRHAAVAQAATFGMRHERLGEEVAAAVVLREGETATEREVQDFVAQTLAPFKVPRLLVIVDEIPRGATGKVQRVALADELGLPDEPPPLEPGRSAFLEESLRAIWADVLGLEDVEPTDDFFGLGGDSILGAEAVARVRELVGDPDLPLLAIVRAPTPRGMSAEIEDRLAWKDDGLVPLRTGDGREQPLFLVHGVDGDVIRFARLARMLGPAHSVYGMRAPGHVPGVHPVDDVAELAAYYLHGMRRVQPRGPYVIGAFCMGATIALELAHRLEAAGEETALVLVDPRLQRPHELRYSLWLVGRRAGEGQLRSAVLRRLRRVLPGRTLAPAPVDRGPVWNALETAREAYVCRPTQAPVALLRSEDFERFDMPDWYLRRVFSRVVLDERVAGEHTELLRPPALTSLHAAMSRALTGLGGA